MVGAYESDAAEPGSQLGHQLMLVSSTYTLARERRLEVTVTMECAQRRSRRVWQRLVLGLARGLQISGLIWTEVWYVR